jgi:CBS domain-containing protein
MTEKIARRGVRVPSEYTADVLGQLWVRDVAVPKVVTLRAEQGLDEVRRWVASGAPGSTHTGYPVIDETGLLMGVVTRRDLFGAHAGSARIGELIRRPPVIVYQDSTLQDALNHMVNHDVGRLPVVPRDKRGEVVGIITRSNILAAYRKRLDETRRREPEIRLDRVRRALSKN